MLIFRYTNSWMYRCTKKNCWMLNVLRTLDLSEHLFAPAIQFFFSFALLFQSFETRKTGRTSFISHFTVPLPASFKPEFCIWFHSIFLRCAFQEPTEQLSNFLFCVWFGQWFRGKGCAATGSLACAQQLVTSQVFFFTKTNSNENCKTS